MLGDICSSHFKVPYPGSMPDNVWGPAFKIFPWFTPRFTCNLQCHKIIYYAFAGRLVSESSQVKMVQVKQDENDALTRLCIYTLIGSSTPRDHPPCLVSIT